MRIARSGLTRQSRTKEALPKTFILTEGVSTEPLYLDAFFSKIRLKNSEVFFFAREQKEIGWANPKTLLERIKAEIAEESFTFSYFSARNFLLSCFANEENDLDAKLFKIEYAKEVQKHCNSLNDKIDLVILEDILSNLSKEFFKDKVYCDFDHTVNELPKLFDDVTFDSEIDKIVLIVDRDAKSFTENQFDYVSSECEKLGYEFLISNPCFEFFLALHLSDCTEFPMNLLLENAVSNSGKNYAYACLKTLDPKFTKERYDVEKYVNSFDTAYANSMKYAIKLSDLKDNVGTNLATWLKAVS